MQGRLVMFGLLLMGCLVYLAGKTLWELTADKRDHGHLLWAHERDAWPGGTIAMRIQATEGKLSRIRVTTTEKSFSVDPKGDSVVDFDVPVAPDCTPGVLVCGIDLDGDGFSFVVGFQPHAPVFGVLRRIGRGLFALAAVLGCAWLFAAAARRGFRRGWGDATASWAVGIPLLFAGYFAFVSPLMAALDVTEFGIALGLMFAWGLLLLVPARAKLHKGLPRYDASPALIATDGVDGPFRGAQHQQKTESADAMIDAWAAAGLQPRRRGREILLAKDGAVGVVPLTRAEIFSDEPFAIHATAEPLARAACDAAGKLLGPLVLTRL